MNLPERLVLRAKKYELLAASCAERAGLAGGDAEQGAAATGFSVAAIVLREVAEALVDDE